MSRLLATLTSLGGFRALAPYVVLAVVMPGGFAVAPLLYWRRRKLGLA